jgi:hypothetical protein
MRPSPRSKDPVSVPLSAAIMPVALSAPNGLLMVKFQLPSAGDELGSAAQDESTVNSAKTRRVGKKFLFIGLSSAS